MRAMAKRTKRRGQTTTFSVSVDLDTKRLLRDVADRSYGGNVSDLIAQIAHQAARQQSAAQLLASHGRTTMTDAECSAFEAEIAAELAKQRPTKRRRRAA